MTFSCEFCKNFLEEFFYSSSSADYVCIAVDTNIILLHLRRVFRTLSIISLREKCPAFGLNMERYSVSLRIQSKWWKTRTRKTPNAATFYAVSMKSTVKSFCWTSHSDSVKHLRLSFFTKKFNSIWPLTMFATKLHHRCLAGVLNRHLNSVWG